MIAWIKNLIYRWKTNQRYKKRIKAMRKKDPFTY